MEKEQKILATLGPANHSIEMIEGLIKARKTCLGLNFFHMEVMNII